MEDVWDVSIKNGKVILRIVENRKWPNKPEVVDVNIELDPINAGLIGASLVHKADEVACISKIDDVHISTQCHLEADELIEQGKRIGAIKCVREHTGLDLKEAKYYVDREWPRS